MFRYKIFYFHKLASSNRWVGLDLITMNNWKTGVLVFWRRAIVTLSTDKGLLDYAFLLWEE